MVLVPIQRSRAVQAGRDGPAICFVPGHTRLLLRNRLPRFLEDLHSGWEVDPCWMASEELIIFLLVFRREYSLI